MQEAPAGLSSPSLLEWTFRKSSSVLANWLWPLLMNSVIPSLFPGAWEWVSHPHTSRELPLANPGSCQTLDPVKPWIQTLLWLAGVPLCQTTWQISQFGL